MKRALLLPAAVKLLFVLMCGAAWYMATARHAINPLLLPSFDDTMDHLWRIVKEGLFWEPLLVTLYELAVAFGLAGVAGVTIGYLVSRSRFGIQVFDPLFSSLYSIPTILLFPLFVLFFGMDTGSKIAMGTAVAFFPIVLTTVAGFGSVEAGLSRAAASMGASGWQMFWMVLLPASLPVILSGLRLGMVHALLAILGTETIASLAGLGNQIVTHSDAMDTPAMFAYIMVVMVVATALNGAVTGLESYAQRKLK